MGTAISERQAAAPATISTTRTAARVSLTAAAAFLVVLAGLHVLKSELDPSWRFISEYAIGRYGWLMVLAFLSLAASCLALFVAVRHDATSAAGKAGLVFLLLSAIGLVIAAVFTADPSTAGPGETTTSGALHGVGTIIGSMSLPLAAAFLTRSLRRNPRWGSARGALLWSALLAWIGFLVFEISFAVMVPGNDLGPDVRIGWPNRLMIATAAVWLIVVASRVPAASSAGREEEAR